MPLGKLRFLHMLFLENEEQPSEKKTSEQCFLGKTKPTCQNSAIFEHFQKWSKTKGTFLPGAFQFSPFLHFHTQQVFRRYLAKFQSVMNIRTCGFWYFIPNTYGCH